MYSPNKDYHLTELLNHADAGNLDAMSELVSLLAVEGYLSDPADHDIRERYISCLETLAANGDAEAYIMLGDAFKDGTGVAQDPQEAIRWYEKAVDAGELFGNECIGMMYYAGDGISQDYEKAFVIFMNTKGEKSFCTIYALGEMYRYGHGVERDERMACTYYNEIVYCDSQYAAMDDYYLRACYRLACAHHYGAGVERDLELALELMEKAKELRAERIDDNPTEISDEEILEEWTRLNQDMSRL